MRTGRKRRTIFHHRAGPPHSLMLGRYFVIGPINWRIRPCDFYLLSRRRCSAHYHRSHSPIAFQSTRLKANSFFGQRSLRLIFLCRSRRDSGFAFRITILSSSRTNRGAQTYLSRAIRERMVRLFQGKSALPPVGVNKTTTKAFLYGLHPKANVRTLTRHWARGRIAEEFAEARPALLRRCSGMLTSSCSGCCRNVRPARTDKQVRPARQAIVR